MSTPGSVPVLSGGLAGPPGGGARESIFYRKSGLYVSNTQWVATVINTRTSSVRRSGASSSVAFQPWGGHAALIVEGIGGDGRPYYGRFEIFATPAELETDRSIVASVAGMVTGYISEIKVQEGEDLRFGGGYEIEASEEYYRSIRWLHAYRLTKDQADKLIASVKGQSAHVKELLVRFPDQDISRQDPELLYATYGRETGMADLLGIVMEYPEATNCAGWCHNKLRGVGVEVDYPDKPAKKSSGCTLM